MSRLCRYISLGERHRPADRSEAMGPGLRRDDEKLLPLLAGGVAGVAGGLALGFQRRFAAGGFFLFAGGGRSRFLGEAGFLGLLRSLLGVARELGLGARLGLRLALGLPLLYRRIIGARLGAKLVQNILSRFLGRFLTVGETDFLESTHLMGLVAFVVWCEPWDASSYPLAGAMSREN